MKTTMKRPASFVVSLLAAALLPNPASAQQPGSDAPPPAELRRPYRGIFGGPPDPQTPQSLVLSASIYGAYDDNITAGITGFGSTDPRLQESGTYVGASAGMSYSLAKNFERISFGVASSAGVNAYRVDSERSVLPNASVAASVGIPMGTRSSLRVTQHAGYTKSYRFLLFPTPMGLDDDGSITADPDLELFERAAFRYGTAVGYTHGFGSRSTLNASYSFSETEYLEEGYMGSRNQIASISFGRRLTNHATLNLGYAYRLAEYALDFEEPYKVHDINIGVAYSRALSFSRRTSISFSTGSAVVASQDLSVPEGEIDPRFRIVGNAALTHEMGRTWTAFAAYNRGLLFREGFAQPFFTDSASAGISGLVTRRFDVSAVARWSFATVDQPGENDHGAVSFGAQARYAINSFLAAFARYIYYTYDFGADIALEPGIPRTLDRQGVRVGLTASVPLIR